MTVPAVRPTIHHAALDDVPPRTLHDLLALRVAVFVVEQDCAYPELDGRDAEPGAVLVWAADDGGPVAGTLRLLTDPDGRARVGRVATAPAFRGRGVARALLDHALDLAAGRETVLDAQSHLAGWYARAGFAVAGAEFVEDGIPHVPMVRPAG